MTPTVLVHFRSTTSPTLSWPKARIGLQDTAAIALLVSSCQLEDKCLHLDAVPIPMLCFEIVI